MYDKTTFDLNETAYAARAPIYITTMFAMLYAGNFLAVAASISHVILWRVCKLPTMVMAFGTCP